MAQQRPIDKPFWATAGINILPDYTAPLSEGPGYVANQKPDFLTWNSIWHRNSKWVKYFDENVAHIKDWAGEANANRFVGTGFAYVVGGGSLTTAAIPGAIYWIDGVRVEIDTSRLTKLGELNHTFGPNKDTYVSITGDSETPLVFQEVNNGAPAPVPPAGYTHIIMVTSDATEVTSVNDFFKDTVSTKYAFYFEVVCSGEKCVFQPVTDVNDIAGAFTTTGTGSAVSAQALGNGFGMDASASGALPAIRARHLGVGVPALEVLGTTGAAAADITGTDGGIVCSTVNGTGLAVTAAGTAIGATINSNSGNGLIVNSSNTLAMSVSGTTGSIVATCTSGTCISASGGATGVNAAGTARGVIATTTADFSIGADITVNGTQATGVSVSATGNNCLGVSSTVNTANCTAIFGNANIASGGTGVYGFASTYGVRGKATEVAGRGVFGESSDSGSTLGSAVYGIAFDDAVGGYFNSANGYGVRISTTQTQRPALRIETQASDPATLSTGDVWMRSTGPKFRLGTDNRQFWGTPDGMRVAKKLQTINENVLPMSSSDVLMATITIPAGSSIMVVAKARLEIAAANTITVQLRKDFVNVLGFTETLNNPGASPLFTTWTATEFINGPVNTGISIFIASGANNLPVRGCQMTLIGNFKTSDITTL